MRRYSTLGNTGLVTAGLGTEGGARQVMALTRLCDAWLPGEAGLVTALNGNAMRGFFRIGGLKYESGAVKSKVGGGFPFDNK